MRMTTKNKWRVRDMGDWYQGRWKIRDNNRFANMYFSSREEARVECQARNIALAA